MQTGQVRWRIVGLLAGFTLVSYLLRMNISIAAKFMMPELGLNQIQMGRVFSAFMLPYAIFQIPAGVFGDRKGPRLTLVLAGLIWGVATLLTGMVQAAGAFATLLVLRSILGAGEAATFPVAARAIANWTPVTERAFANSLMTAGLAAGSCITGPLISWLMVNRGWRACFFWTSLMAFALVAVWRWYATDRPAAHPAIGRSELAWILPGQTELAEHVKRSWWPLLRNRKLGLVCLSYFFDSYLVFVFVFWFYIYLTEVRGFSILGGGIYVSLPYLIAIPLVPAAGRASDRLSLRLGRGKGQRLIALTAFLFCAVLLYVGASATNPYTAIVCLSVSVAFLLSTEGPFWWAATEIGGGHAGAAGGIMNTAGNLGGVVSTALVPVLVKHFGWAAALGSGAAFAIVAAIIWWFIRFRPEASYPTRPAPLATPAHSGGSLLS